jgi:succinoglycan biosynthesis protein ExoL
MRRVALLVVSSPGFVSHYFSAFHPRLPPLYLLENKLMFSEALPRGEPTTCAPPPPPAGPWKIGWFGVIRCPRSLAALAALSRSSGGGVEVVIAGKIADNLEPIFEAVLRDAPGLTYLGAYDRARDLARLYGGVHFTWAVDFYEAGGNSDWLLPNRLYEGGYWRSVAIALAGVETGRWLARQGMGVLIGEAFEDDLHAIFQSMGADAYRSAKQVVDAASDDLFVQSRQACAAFGARLAQLSGAAD